LPPYRDVGVVQTRVTHPALAPLLAPWLVLEASVHSKALQRLRFDALEGCVELADPASPW
jgi:hypothetical protein